MSTTPVIPADEAVIVMTRIYEAPRDLVAALTASYVPARRASRADAMTALRQE